MATIDQDVAQIRQAIYGKDVREAIADGIEQTGQIVNQANAIANQANASANDVKSNVSYYYGNFNGDDIDDINQNSMYFVSFPRTAPLEHWPFTEKPGWIETSISGTQEIQFAYPWRNDLRPMYRVSQHGTWNSWCSLESVDVSTKLKTMVDNYGLMVGNNLNVSTDTIAYDQLTCSYDASRGMYHLQGTLDNDSSWACNISVASQGFLGLVKGKTYRLALRTENTNTTKYPMIQVFKNTAQSGETDVLVRTNVIRINEINNWSVPSDANGLLFRIYANEPGNYDVYCALECVSENVLTPYMSNIIRNSLDGYLPSCDLNTIIQGNHFYLLIDTNTYEHMPLSSLHTGFLEVKQSDAWGKQIFYELNGVRSWVRTFNHGQVSEAGWLLNQSGGDTYNITQEISRDTIQNTYTINTSPQITTDTNDYLQAVDNESTSEANATDMTGAIMAMLNSTSHCKLGPGVFYVSGNIDMPDNSMIEGCGNKTILRLLSSVSTGYILRIRRYNTVKDIRFSGGTSVPTNLYTQADNMGSRHGIYMVANADGHESAAPSTTQCIITNCWFENFDGSAFYAHNTGGGIHSSVIFSDSHIEHCRVGLNIDYYNEYAKYSNLVIYQCYYACINNGGNNLFTACTFHGVVGWLTDNSNNDKSNNQHGSCVGCTFNHIDNMNHPSELGNGKAVHIINGSAGFIFTGCQLWYGNIYIDNSIGVQFSDCLFGNNAIEIEVTGSYPAFFFNNIFWTTPTLNVSTSCKFEGNYLRSGTVVGL